MSTTVTRVPTSDSAVAWTKSSGGSNYALVDDPVGTPDDSDYTYTGTVNYIDRFGYTAFAVPNGATNISVSVISRAYRLLPGDKLRCLIYIGSTVYLGPADISLGGTFVDYTQTWSVNPSTTNAWTYSEVNAIGGFGYKLVAMFSGSISYVSQCYISVTYTASTPLNLADGVKTGDSKTFSFSKALTDGSKIADSKVLGVGKLLSDGSKIADSKVLGVGKLLSDGSKIGDSKVLGVGKLLADGSKIADDMTKLLSKYLSLVVGVKIGDSITSSFSKLLSDGSKIADSKVLGVGKLLADGSKIADSKVLGVGKLLSDGSKIADSKVLGVGKLLSDGTLVAESVITLIGHSLYIVLSDAIKASGRYSDSVIKWTKTIFGTTIWTIYSCSSTCSDVCSTIWSKISDAATLWTKSGSITDSWTKKNDPTNPWTKKK
jgi:carbonic anhydrase/acetyltransferase-like protein (isoleucine patch superfamily)